MFIKQHSKQNPSPRRSVISLLVDAFAVQRSAIPDPCRSWDARVLPWPVQNVAIRYGPATQPGAAALAGHCAAAVRSAAAQNVAAADRCAEVDHCVAAVRSAAAQNVAVADRCAVADHCVAADRCAVADRCVVVVQSARADHVARVALKREPARFWVLPARDAVTPRFVREVLDAPDAPRGLPAKVCDKARSSPGVRPGLVLRSEEFLSARQELPAVHLAGKIGERLAAELYDRVAPHGHHGLEIDLHHDRPEHRDLLRCEDQDCGQLHEERGSDARPHRWVASQPHLRLRLELEIPGDVPPVRSKHEIAAILYQAEGPDSAPRLRSFFPESRVREPTHPFASMCDAPGDLHCLHWPHLHCCLPLLAGWFRAQV